MSMLTGVALLQPPGQEKPLQVSELVGAAESDWAVKVVPRR